MFIIYILHCCVRSKVKNYYTFGQSEHDKDYICSMENNNGIHRCDLLPQRIYEDVVCTRSFEGNLTVLDHYVNRPGKWNK